MIPLFFQVVLLDSASKAGMRLVIPSLATPIGGLFAGFIMSRWGMLSHLVRLGCFLMMLGNGIVASLQYHDSNWKYLVYLFPANLGQGIVYPSILFTNIAAFEQSRKSKEKKKKKLCEGSLKETNEKFRTSSFNINGLPLPLHGYRVGRRRSLNHNPEHPLLTPPQRIVRNTR
jgi:hypothetical protein